MQSDSFPMSGRFTSARIRHRLVWGKQQESRMLGNESLECDLIAQHTILRKSIAPARLSSFCLTSVGRPQPAFHLVPNLAVRFGVTPIQSGAPSYLMRVWPGGRGTMLYKRVSPCGVPKRCSASPCPPDVLIFLLTSYCCQLR